MSSATTITKVITLVMKKTMPNPANRRIADRSVVALDSSWPDCHESWKLGSRRCRCAYRSSRMERSMPVTTPASGLHPPAEQVQRHLGDSERDRGQADRHQQPALVVTDRPVDRCLGEQRNHDLGAGGDHRGEQHEDQLAVIRPKVLAAPQQCCERNLNSPPGRRGLRRSMQRLTGRLRGHYPEANRLCT